MSESVVAHYGKQSFTFAGPDGDHLIRAIRNTGTFYERDLLDTLAAYLKGGAGLVIDVGANIGNHSLFFTCVLGRDCICIEPQAAAIEYLSANLSGNGVGNYTVHKCGLSDAPGTANIATRGGNLGASKLTDEGDGERVEVVTLDDISANLPKIDLIKIDAEGMEAKIIRGAMGTIKRHRPLVTAEAHSPADLAEIKSIFYGLNYKAHGPFCWTPTYILVPEERASLLVTALDLVRHPKRAIRARLARVVNL